jgi:hypothetical protein
LKTDWTVYIYKQDRRYTTGQRLYSTTVWTGRDAAGIEREVVALKQQLYPDAKGWCIVWEPQMKTVKNLMTGADIEIPTDTPRSCDPSSELYWSM